MKMKKKLFFDAPVFRKLNNHKSIAHTTKYHNKKKDRIHVVA